jgi:hypothetical protein
MAERVEVDFMHGDTPDVDRFTAERAWIRVFPPPPGAAADAPSRGRVRLQNGRDEDGAVSYALYSQVIRIKRRPVREEPDAQAH